MKQVSGTDERRPGQLQAFEAVRPRLLGLAYRILGSHADAEDAVQDTFLKWQADEREAVANPAAWLTTVCTRHCLDMLRAGDRARVDYVGPWLPEPVQTAADAGEDVAMAASLTTAFLLALQRLTPKERAAYLLYEIFDMPYPDVARTLGLQEPACRQLVARARGHIERGKVRQVTPPDRQRRLLDAFGEAVATGSTSRLARLLAADVRLSADGGGKVSATRRIMRGPAEVLRFVEAGLHVWWAGAAIEEVALNGGRGLLVRDGGGITAAVSFGYDADGRLGDIFVMRNPDKLARLDPAALH
ncbi:RNA polymerase sigma factor SigJ [Coralloluteibacterium stylophorae]|uniref:RNA polymerase sigma factor SigJ n=1 Tax=Coralloluteibacterium stylophorae TaxID=1776034 RepID=A0A8J7VUI4_9GAMM|nr:RNA polymerase sigma factor SigJ [Coralloluteibacterium stylophorae]MBS7455575.1 RNA polymerase sigma factor SigJ [Coralloluteibacterium stylophorae]